MKSTKRGRPKRKVSENDESHQSFSHKPKKSQSKRNLDEKMRKLASKKSKSKFDLDSSSDQFSDSDMEDENKFIKVPIQSFNPNKVFAEILNKANKQPQFLILIKNLLSGYSQTLQDKKNQINKKWNQLRNSNCTQDQYLARESQLRRMQTQEIREIKEDIISKLSYANIKGFQTRLSLINEHKIQNPQQQGQEVRQYIIEDSVWDKYHEDQLHVLEMLMKEKDFVSKYYEVPMNLITSKSSTQPTQITNKEEEKQMQNKFNNLEENSESTEFLFCKHYNSINYDKLFQSSNPFKLTEDEKFYIDSQAMGWLLESKSDQIYTNEKFQKQTFANYSQLLKKMYQNPTSFSEAEIMNKILQISAYILNSVHYYQKFKLKCQLLHPLDVLLVIDKLLKGKPGREELKERIKSVVDSEKMINEAQEHYY